MHGALKYAEENLGAHVVYQEAEASAEDIKNLEKQLLGAVLERRRTEDAILEREMDLVIENRAKFDSLTQAALDRKIKTDQHKDLRLRELRIERSSAANEVARLELEIDSAKWRLKVKVARMNELAGYFNYLAAVKNAESSAT